MMNNPDTLHMMMHKMALRRSEEEEKDVSRGIFVSTRIRKERSGLPRLAVTFSTLGGAKFTVHVESPLDDAIRADHIADRLLSRREAKRPKAKAAIKAAAARAECLVRKRMKSLLKMKDEFQSGGAMSARQAVSSALARLMKVQTVGEADVVEMWREAVALHVHES